MLLRLRDNHCNSIVTNRTDGYDGCGWFSMAWLTVAVFIWSNVCLLQIAALMGCRLRAIPKTSIVARTILGVAIGASITCNPKLIASWGDLLYSLALIPVLI